MKNKDTERQVNMKGERLENRKNVEKREKK